MSKPKRRKAAISSQQSAVSSQQTTAKEQKTDGQQLEKKADSQQLTANSERAGNNRQENSQKAVTTELETASNNTTTAVETDSTKTVETAQPTRKVTWEEKLGSFALENTGLLFGLILVLATVLRLFNLGARSVWYDESFTIILSSRDIGTILNGTAHDYHPPLSYLLLAGWEQIFGTGVWSARLLSTIYGVGAVAAIFLLAKMLFGSRTALLAAFFAAVSPFEILYSQEVRMYSLEAALGALLLYVFYRAYRYDAIIEWVWFVVVATLALYNLYFSVFALITLDLFFVVALFSESYTANTKKQRYSKLFVLPPTLRNKMLRWLVANVIVSFLYLPWLLMMLGQVAKVQKSYWIPRPNPLEFLRLFAIYLFNTTNLTVDNWLATLGLLLSAITFVFLLYRLRFKLKTGEKGRYRRSFEVALCLSYWIIPVLIVLVVSYLFSPIYLDRSLIAFATPVYILLARVVQVAKCPRNWLWLLLPGFAVVIGSLGFYYFSRFYTQHYELNQTAAYVEAHYQSGDITVHTNKLSYLPFEYLQTPGPQYLIPEQPDSPHNDLSSQTAEAINLSYTPIADAVNQHPNSRIWVIVTDPQPDTDPLWWQKTAQSWLTLHNYHLVNQTAPDIFWGETVLLYQK